VAEAIAECRHHRTSVRRVWGAIAVPSQCSLLAHRVISLPRGNRVAFGMKRTSIRARSETRLVSARP
jgi:hypothetical protein